MRGNRGYFGLVFGSAVHSATPLVFIQSNITRTNKPRPAYTLEQRRSNEAIIVLRVSNKFCVFWNVAEQKRGKQHTWYIIWIAYSNKHRALYSHVYQSTSTNQLSPPSTRRRMQNSGLCFWFPEVAVTTKPAPTSSRCYRAMAAHSWSHVWARVETNQRELRGIIVVLSSRIATPLSRSYNKRGYPTLTYLVRSHYLFVGQHFFSFAKGNQENCQSAWTAPLSSILVQRWEIIANLTVIFQVCRWDVLLSRFRAESSA